MGKGHWAWLLVLAFVVPAGAHNGERHTSAPTTLYFHVNGFQDFPVNTQRPGDFYKEDASIGVATESATCLPAGTPIDGITQHAYHTFYGFSSGAVDYNLTTGQIRMVGYGRAPGHDIQLDAGKTITLHYFLSTQTGVSAQGLVDPNSAPLVVPQVFVRATLRTGEQISRGAESYNAGTVLAQGQSPPADLAGEQTRGAIYEPMPDGTRVYEFVVPLAYTGNGTVPGRDGFNVRIDVAEAIPGCDKDPDHAIMTNSVRVHSSPEHRPRLELSSQETLTVATSSANLTAAGIEFHFSPMSAWGSYDVDATGFNFTLQGPNGPVAATPVPHVMRFHVHGEESKPMDHEWVLNVTNTNASAGTYTAKLRFSNLQHTANETEALSFDYQPAKASPGIGPLLGLTLLGVAALSRRR